MTESTRTSRVRAGTAAARGAPRAVRERLERTESFLPAQLTMLAAIVLYLTLPKKLTVGPNWLLPAVEALLLVGLVVATPRGELHHSPKRRRVALLLTGLVSVVSLASLFLLVHYLLKGGKAGGHPLVLAGIVLWITNVLLFAVWYWELDRDGPVARVLDPHTPADFLFPQMSEPNWSPAGWLPGFLDYLYVSFTNATAFSPTDTMPLTQRAKVLMMVQSAAALVTIGLVVARAVNILA
jgi:uncharacterized membrane protein